MAPWSLFYASFFCIYGLWVTFGPARLLQSFPQWAATSLALSSLVYFVALPAAQWTWKRIGFSWALALWGGLAAVAYGAPVGWPELLPLALPFGSLGAAGTYGITETYMIEALAAQGRGHAFGPVRKWGSLGFLVAAAGGGIALDWMGGVQRLERLLALAAISFALSCAWLIRHQRRGSLPEASAVPITAADVGEVEPVAEGSEGRPDGDAASALATPAGVRQPAGLSIWLVGAAVLAIVLHRVAENQTTAWFGAMWMHAGHSTSEAGVLAAWAVAAEFIAMGASAAWLARRDLGRLMLVCSLISALRWWATPWCTEFACAAVLQTAHAVSFGVFYPASLLWLRAHRPGDFFRAKYVMEGATRGLSSGYYFLAASTLIPVVGYAATFRGCAALAAASVLLWCLLPARVIPRR
jgi:PPP family 3-phenylpropionic acid transporter